MPMYEEPALTERGSKSIVGYFFHRRWEVALNETSSGIEERLARVDHKHQRYKKENKGFVLQFFTNRDNVLVDVGSRGTSVHVCEVPKHALSRPRYRPTKRRYSTSIYTG